MLTLIPLSKKRNESLVEFVLVNVHISNLLCLKATIQIVVSRLNSLLSVAFASKHFWFCSFMNQYRVV